MARPPSNPYTPEEEETLKTIIESRPEGLSIKDALAKDLHLLRNRTIDGALYHYYQAKNKNDLSQARKRAEKRAKKTGKNGRPTRVGLGLETWTSEEDAILWNTVKMTLRDEPNVGLREALRQAVEILPGRTFSSVINRYYGLRNKMGEDEQPEQMAFAPYTGEQTRVPPKETADAWRPEPQPPAPSVYDHIVPPADTPPDPWRSEPQRPAAPPAPPAHEQLMPPAPTVDPGPLVSRAEDFIRELYSVVENNSSLRQEVQTLRADSQSVSQLRADLEAERAKNVRLMRKIAELEEDQGAFLKLMDKARQIGRSESGV